MALLSGISEHIGFPAAPDVLGASEEEVVDDLESMGVSIDCTSEVLHYWLGSDGGLHRSLRAYLRGQV